MSNKIFLNDNLVDIEEAKISVFDRGYLFSDGIYELIPFFKGKPFLLEDHYQRLERSLDMVGISNPYSKAEWKDKIYRFSKENDYKNFSLYIQITRGVPSDFSDGIFREHAATKKYTSSVTMFTSEIKGFPSFAPKREKAIILDDKRWLQCDIKSISLIYNAYAKTLASRSEAYEAILVRNNNITEGCSSNVFIVKDSVIKTCPKTNLILPGITRSFIINQIIKKNNYKFKEENFSLDELKSADEIFVTNSTQGVIEINKLDDKEIGDGEFGPISKKIYENFVESVN